MTPSFQTPDNIGAHISNTHEAGVSVPPNRAMAGATLHTIMVAGCPASLPPLSFEVVNLAHVDGSKGSCTRTTEPNSGAFAEWQKDLLAS